MRSKRLLISMLAILLIVSPLLASCEDEKNNGKTSSTISTKDDFPLEVKDFDDTTIRILCVSSSRHRYGEVQFVGNDENKGNVINDAVQKRNDYIEEKFGLKMEIAPVTYPGDEIKLSIQSGTDEYQLVNDAVYKMLPNATQNYYWSLEKYLKLDSPWWDQNAIDNLTVTDKTYFVAGDALITDDDNTYLILFNKEMYENHSDLTGKYGSLYQLVKDGKWTYDVMTEMAKVVSKPDENGEWATKGGTYGLLGDNYGSGILVSGSGAAEAEKSADGTFKLTVDSERSVNAFNKVFELMADTSKTIRVEQFPDNTGWKTISDMFINKQGLFYMTAASSISTIKNTQAEKIVDYGVLPIPKYSKDQDKYYNGINIYQSTVLAVPTTNVEKLDATIYLLEALGYYSKNFSGESVAHAYYETTLKLQAVNSYEDEEMLDLVFNNRLYDIGAIYNWGGNLLGVYSKVLRSGSNTLISYFETIKDAAQTEMEKTIEEYKNLAS
jgi:hypothetical protein